MAGTSLVQTLQVAAGYDVHASHADFFAFPWNCDVVSHPVKLWKNGNALDFSSPNALQILLML